MKENVKSLGAITTEVIDLPNTRALVLFIMCLIGNKSSRRVPLVA